MTLSPALVSEIAHDAGFDLVRFGPLDPGAHGPRFAEWLDAGRHGEMQYLARNRERILDPTRFAPHAKSAIALGFDYGGPPGALRGGGRVARYAVGRDYHRSLGARTARIRSELARAGVAFDAMKVGTDAVPVLERALAVRAGIGFLAKSAGVIHPRHGPYLMLSEVLVPFELPHDGPSPGSCGTCTRCIDACPTQAITAPHEVDARRCLSYTTIELRGPIPRDLRSPQGEWVFGCDVCLEVCPYTRFGRGALPIGAERPADLRPHRVVETFTLVGMLELSANDYETQWTGTAMRRATRSGLRRNAAVVLGNLRDGAALPALTRALGDEDAVVRSHAAWAIGRIGDAHGVLRAALATERDLIVQGELRAAIDGEP